MHMAQTFVASTLSGARRCAIFPMIACLVLAASCEGAPGFGMTTLKARSLQELGAQLLNNTANLDTFRQRGPFATTLKKDFEIFLPPSQRIKADLYLSAPPDKAPLVILLHGYGNSKDDHAYQALHLATWGMHSLSLTLPNKGPWLGHGATLARIVALIRDQPEIIDSRIDPRKIILAGHSFGASAVSVALAEGAEVAGGILLDPAGVGRNISTYLRKIRVPVISIASDERVTLTRNRGYFYQYVPRDIVTVSIVNASHEDAQFPLEAAKPLLDSDSSPEEELQITYVSGLTSAALSLALTGKIDYAWESFGAAVRNSRMFGEMRK